MSGVFDELDCIAMLPVYAPPKPEDEDDRYLLRGAVLALVESGKRDIAAALAAQVPAQERVRAAAVKACEDHFEAHHVAMTPPCAAALQDARWWARVLGINPDPISSEAESRPKSDAAGSSPASGHQRYTGPHRPVADGLCEHRWANRQTKAVHCYYADGWNEGRARGDAQASLARLDLEEVRDALRTIRDWCLDAYAADGIAAAEKVWKPGVTAVFNSWNHAEAVLGTESAQTCARHQRPWGDCLQDETCQREPTWFQP